MKFFTVIAKKRVLRVKAKSIQQLTRALRDSGIVWQAIHEDKDEERDHIARLGRCGDLEGLLSDAKESADLVGTRRG